MVHVHGPPSADPLSICLSPEESAKVSFLIPHPGLILALDPQGIKNKKKGLLYCGYEHLGGQHLGSVPHSGICMLCDPGQGTVSF